MSSRPVTPSRKLQTPKNVGLSQSPRSINIASLEKKPLDQETKVLGGVVAVFVSYIMYSWGSCSESRLTNFSTDGSVSNEENGQNQVSLGSSMGNYVLAVLVLSLCVAIKRVLDKRSKDYRPSSYVNHLTAKDCKKQMKAATSEELYKLKESKEFQLMQSVKGNNVEEWNWQRKERIGGNEIFSEFQGEDDDNLEEEILRMDQEIKEAGGSYLKSMSSSPTRKSTRLNNRVTPSTVGSHKEESD